MTIMPKKPGLVAVGAACVTAIAAAGTCMSWVAMRMAIALLRPYLWPAAVLAAFTEACFYAYFRLRYRQLAAVDGVPHGLDPMRAFEKYMQLNHALPDAFDKETYISTWFKGAPLESVKAGNVDEFIAYGFFYRTREQMEAEGMGDLPTKCRQRMEASLNLSFPPGYTPGLRFMDHLWDRLRVHYRPLGFYLFMELLGRAARVAMTYMGFTQHHHGSFTYYTYNPPSTPSQQAAGGGSSSSTTGGFTATSTSCTDTGSSRPEAAAAEPSSSSGDTSWSSKLWNLLPSQGQQPAGAAESLGGGVSPAQVSPDVPPLTQQLHLQQQQQQPELLQRNQSLSAMYAAAASAVLQETAAAQAQGSNPLAGAKPAGNTPVLFLHGVGGLGIYLEMLHHVLALGHPVLVVEFPHVSMRLCSSIPSVDEIASGILDILEHEGLSRVAVIAHSYGTFVASRLVQRHPERLTKLCLIDPVCFGMFMPHLLHNFIYRRPRLDLRRPRVVLSDSILYFASRELHIAATFCRKFYWTELNLWPQDVPEGSVVILHGDDDLCHAADTRKMLSLSPGTKVIENADLFHGAFLLYPGTKASILQEVHKLLTSTGSAANWLLRQTLSMATPLMESTLSSAASWWQGEEGAGRRLTTHGSLQLDRQPVAWLRTASSSIASFVARRRAILAEDAAAGQGAAWEMQGQQQQQQQQRQGTGREVPQMMEPGRQAAAAAALRALREGAGQQQQQHQQQQQRASMPDSSSRCHGHNPKQEDPPAAAAVAVAVPSATAAAGRDSLDDGWVDISHDAAAGDAPHDGSQGAAAVGVQHIAAPGKGRSKHAVDQDQAVEANCGAAEALGKPLLQAGRTTGVRQRLRRV